MIPVPPIRFDLALARRLAMCSLRAYDPSGLPSGIRWGERTREPSVGRGSSRAVTHGDDRHDAVPSPTNCQAHPPASSLSPQRGEGARVSGGNDTGLPISRRTPLPLSPTDGNRTPLPSGGASQYIRTRPTLLYDSLTDAQVLVEDIGDAIVLAFRGTKYARDWLIDCDFLLTEIPHFALRTSQVTGANTVHLPTDNQVRPTASSLSPQRGATVFNVGVQSLDF